jgi:hypothetical protein
MTAATPLAPSRRYVTVTKSSGRSAKTVSGVASKTTGQAAFSTSLTRFDQNHATMRTKPRRCTSWSMSSAPALLTTSGAARCAAAATAAAALLMKKRPSRAKVIKLTPRRREAMKLDEFLSNCGPPPRLGVLALSMNWPGRSSTVSSADVGRDGAIA